MRLTCSRLAIALFAIAACGDDSNSTPDAKTADAKQAEPDAAGPTFKGYDANEGGEVRVEYIRFPNGGVGARTTAYFFKNAGSTKFFPFLNLNGCTDETNPTTWPMATNPLAEREYYDVGSVVITGGPSTYTIPRRTMQGRDPFYREHPANEWYFDPAASTDMDGANLLGAATRYDVTLTGSADFPAVIYDDVIYMPADFELTAPGHAGPLTFPANTAQTFTWSTPTDTPPTGYEVLSLVAFTGAQGPAVVCVEPNDGSLTVPAAMMDVARTKYPTGGTVARQTLTHAVREMVDKNGPTGKRIDFLGVWCYAGTSYVAQ